MLHAQVVVVQLQIQEREDQLVLDHLPDLTIKFVGEDGEVIEHEVYKAPGAGVAMAMYNQDASIREFAHASLAYGLP